MFDIEVAVLLPIVFTVVGVIWVILMDYESDQRRAMKET